MVRIKDIADTMQVAISTVSRALRDSDEISEDVKAEVRRVADNLGYHARQPKTHPARNANLIGIIAPEFKSSYYASLVETLGNKFSKAGLTPVYALSHFTSSSFDDRIRDFTEKQVKCILAIIDGYEDDIDLGPDSFLNRLLVPAMIITGNHTPNLDLDSLYVDDQWGTFLAVEHLVALNHQKIGFIGEVMTLNRQVAFVDAMTKSHLTVSDRHVKVGVERSSEGGYLRTKELLRESSYPTALYVGYDEMVIGVVAALTEAGLKVPEDMSVVSFDNITAARYICGGLTTIDNPVEDMSAISVRILMDRIRDNTRTVQQISLKPKIVVRKSTAAI